MKWINQLLPILEEYKDGGEPLNGDEVDSLCSIIKAKINLQEGNITDAECDRILDGEPETYVTPTCKEVPMPDGLQEYIDGVGLNVLYRNYHKSTNGTWSRAEVEECVEDDHGEYFIVNVDFGCQDDTRNESYRVTIHVYNNGKEWRVNRTIPTQTDKEDA